MNQYLNFVKQLNYFFFLCLAASLPLPRKLGQVMMIIWAISWLFELRFTRKENLHWGKHLIPVFGFALLTIWESISLIWGAPCGGRFQSSHASLLIFPLIALFGVNELYDWKQIAKVFVISCFASIFLYGFTLCWMNNMTYIQARGAIEWTPFSFFYYDSLLSGIKHRLYYCMNLILAMILLWFLRREQERPTDLFHKVMYEIMFWGGEAAFLFTLYVTGSRASLIALMVFAVVIAWNAINKKYRTWVTAGMVGLVCLSGWLLWNYHPRLKNIELDYITHAEKYASTNHAQHRMIIWTCAAKDADQYIWKGLGVGNARKFLVERYERIGYTDGILYQYMPHSQYLLVTMELGVFALIFFIALWLTIPFCQPRGSLAREFATYFTILWGLNMLTDDILLRIEGVVYVCVTLLFIQILARQNPNPSGK